LHIFSYLQVQFAKPLQMNFTMSSWKENLCGIPRDSSMPTILAGDIMNMTASLSCITALNSTIDVMSMFLQQPNTTGSNNNNNTSKDFRYLDAKTPRRFSFIPSEYGVSFWNIFSGSLRALWR
jgi:hypothetical protein